MHYYRECLVPILSWRSVDSVGGVAHMALGWWSAFEIEGAAGAP